MAAISHVEPGLIWQLKQRDQTAFLELYDRTIADVSKLVSYLLDDPSALDDVIQEIYVALYSALPKFDPDKPFQPWLMGIVVRQVNAYRRRNWRAHRTKSALARSVHGAHQPDPADGVADSLEGRAIVQAIRSLPVKLRSVVVLHYLHEYTRDEISNMLGIPPGTVASRLRLALVRLRRDLWDQRSEKEVLEDEL